MFFRAFFFLSISLTLSSVPFAQSQGQTMRTTYVFKGYDFESQIPGFLFTNPQNGKMVSFSYNQTVDLPDFYEGLPLEGLDDYKGKRLVIDLIYMKHLCNEGSFNYSCTDWVIRGINPEGTPKTTRTITLPKVGRIIDPDGYVNVRSQMNVKSEVVGVLEPDYIEEECFYFYPCTDPNWLKVDFEYNGQYLKGYIHKSRVVLL
jgi:hypothetical protein